MLDYTGEKYDHLPPGRAANLSKIMFVKDLLANTRKVLPGGVNVAVLCALSGNNNLQFHHEASCALRRAAAATQFAIGWHKALQQCQESAQDPGGRPRRSRDHHGREGQPRGREEGARRARGNSVITPGLGRVQQGKDWSSSLPNYI